MNINLSPRVVLVTGATRGIGKAIANTLGQAGAIVAGTATSSQGADTITQAIKDAGITGKGYQLDVTNSDSIQSVLEQINTDFDMPSILVNNAGITRDNLMVRMKTDEWQDVINTNLTAIFNMNKALLKSMMKAKWGRIITIGSIVGNTGNPGQVNYCAAKAGLLGITKAMALEIASRNITVNVVAPGMIDTDMTKALDDKQREAIFEQIPMKKLGQPEDIANAVLFLASDLAQYITGETIHVNGGMYMA